MEIQTIVEEARRAQLAFMEGKATPTDVKREIAENLYPLIGLVCEALSEFGGRLDEAEGVLTEFLTSDDSTIMPELSLKICAVLAITQKLCDEIEASWPKETSMPESLSLHIDLARAGSQEVSKMVEEATASPDDNDQDESQEEANDGADNDND